MTIYKYGIDISQWQRGLNLANFKDKFVIIRAGYGCRVDKAFNDFVRQCKLYNIPMGFYWYSYAVNVAQAREEAQQFLRTVSGIKVSCGLWLDMEDADGYKKRHGVLYQKAISDMCRAFMTELDKGGIYCGIYSSKSWFGTYITGCEKWDKWVASWGKNNGYLTTNTSNLGTMQQYTSRPIDKDVIYTPIETYTKNSKQPDVSRGPHKSNSTIADEVLKGLWGNGKDRKNRLTNAGYDYNAIQRLVNIKLGARGPHKSNSTIVDEVLKGLWGNGKDRKNRLTNAGYDYNAIQRLVNIKLAARDVIAGKFGNGATRKRRLKRYGFTENDIVEIQKTVNNMLKK